VKKTWHDEAWEKYLDWQGQDKRTIKKIFVESYMEFTQLNIDWNADPNAPCPLIKISDSDLLLSFHMNVMRFNNYSSDDFGILEFHNCIQFRMGEPNEEGWFCHEGDRYKQHGIEWGEFYCIGDSDWQANFGEPVYKRESPLTFNELCHYLFYFRDETFECVAENYDFYVRKFRP